LANSQELEKGPPILLAVGSLNPVKIGAVRVVMQRVAAEGLMPGVPAATVEGLEVSSGVSDQPVGDEETHRGALSRARAALAGLPGAEYGVGLEGGILKLAGEVYTCAWCVIVDRSGNVSAGGGLIMPLPPPIVRDLEAGYELGDATDRLYGVKHSKHAGGALGYLSKNLRSRQDAYEGIFTYALAKFLSPELYEVVN
jgi:inosine/xanthosine triphosphatase